ncbi:MAG: hypothetical protein GW892_32515, partial [Armatimonadetes bacterium]|nr:hypothetical protein [Armatimonadota bacterium]
YDPYRPLIQQGPLPAAVQQALQGILLFPAQGAAALPGAVHLKPGIAPSPVLPVTTSGSALSPLLPVTPAAVDPLTGSPVHPPTPSAVDQRSVLYLTRLQAGDHAPEVMEWLESLPKEQVISLLEKTPWRKDDHAVCDALVQVLLDTHQVPPEKAAELPPLCALRVAQSLGARGDKRCEPVFERLLDQHRANEALAVPAVLAFAEYYQFVGDHAKSAETFRRAKDYTKAANTLANCTVEAARSYMQAGSEAEAERLYGEVAKYGYGWATGMALVDQARCLIQAGEYGQARTLLSTPVAGRYSDQIRVGTLLWLACCDYRTGDLDSADRHCTEVIEQYQGLPTPLGGEGLEELVREAEMCKEWIARWRRSPLQSIPPRLRVTVARNQKATRVRFLVRSPREIALRAHCPDPRVRPSLGATWRRPHDYYVETEGWVDIDSASLKEDLSVEIGISSLEDEEATVRVVIPLEVRCACPVRASPNQLWFGFVLGGERTERTLELSASTPFQIHAAGAGDAAVSVVAANAPTRAKVQVLRVTLQPVHLRGAQVGGQLTIVTDLNREEPLLVPYVAYVE